jgi:hypothetical protein
MQGRVGRIGITLTLPPDHLKDNLNDGRRKGCNGWVFRRMVTRRTAIPALPLFLTLHKPEDFDKFIVCLMEATTGPFPFIKTIENYI